jgi:hypothetical protein
MADDKKPIPLPPLPELSWPDTGDRRRDAILLGSQMAEAEALWQLKARAAQVRAKQRQAAKSGSLTPPSPKIAPQKPEP